MQINSLGFLVFFICVFIIHNLLPKGKVYKYFLIVANYFFYCSLSLKYAMLLLLVSLVTYLFSKILISYNKKFFLCTYLFIVLSILFIFKYYNFVADILKSIFGKYENNITIPTVEIIVPIGLSFYLFQAMSLIIEIYRKNISMVSFEDTIAYLSFFPTITAGPIIRPKTFFEQLNFTSIFSYDDVKRSILKIAYGMAQKMIIADRIKIIVNFIYSNYAELSSISILLGICAYSIEIYCDFAGYSNMAIGVAELLGFKIPKNFDNPYFSDSVTNFWKKWHISLTSWFRDYLYIPLGGNRKGKARKCINIIIVFAISGLWHGAKITFLIWGIINGILQVIEFLGKRSISISKKRISKFLASVKNFLIVSFVWIFFDQNL